jgi:DNA invertase Pin-like site-specific DNA recombinase
MIYGYIRVSTDKQDVEGQKIGIIKKASELGIEIEQWITDDGISGTKEPEKRALGKLLKKIKSNDVIISSEISRLGRTLFMVMRILEHCMKNDCKVYTVKDGYELGNNIQSKVMAFAFGIAAEIERDMISKRTKEGLAKRKADGVVLGRPLGKKTLVENLKCSKHESKIKSCLNKGLSYSATSKLLGINRNTIKKFVDSIGFETNIKAKSNVTKFTKAAIDFDTLFESKKFIEIYSKEFSIKSISIHYNCSVGKVSGFLRRHPEVKTEMLEIAKKQRKENPAREHY